MFGLALGTVELVVPGQYKVIIKSVKDIAFTIGITKLVYVVLYNLLSEYRSEFQTGSEFGNHIQNIVQLVTNPQEASMRIADELENVKNRIVNHQKKANTNNQIPKNELLREIRVLNITINEELQSVDIDIEVINELGEKGFIKV